MTFAEAEAVIDEDGHGEAEDDPDGLAQVYVSPEIEGWTLVIGPWCDPCSSDRSDEVLRLCIGVSSRYGVAQVYYFGTQNDGSAWLIAEHGGAMLRTCGSAPGGTWRAYLPERAAGLAMVFKLVEAAQARWRAVNGAHLVPLVRAGARFERGRLVEHPEAVAA
ncbi:hypothetical protein J0670_00560 [Streptomyces sp. FH025]|nr:hypothetical protein [Streptomyces sp. FH025]